MVMDRIFEIIPHIAGQHKTKMKIMQGNPGIKKSFSALLYADDTLLCENTENENQALLWAVEEVLGVFGLMLNKKKCQKISVSITGNIIFLDGTTVPEGTEAEYLGGILTDDTDCKKEVSKRMATAGQCRYQLGNFWRRGAMIRKRKIYMYEAIISAKLMYALDITPLPKGEMNRLDAAFFKGLRQIMGLKTTHGQTTTGEARSQPEKIHKEEWPTTTSRTYRTDTNCMKEKARTEKTRRANEEREKQGSRGYLLWDIYLSCEDSRRILLWESERSLVEIIRYSYGCLKRPTEKNGKQQQRGHTEQTQTV
jgi:hypothetical protein